MTGKKDYMAVLRLPLGNLIVSIDITATGLVNLDDFSAGGLTVF